MSVQSNINQGISLASLLITQTPGVKTRQEGLAYQKRQEQAIRGLSDIEKNLEREEATSKIIDRIGPPTAEEAKFLEEKGKVYNKEELENIESRTKQYQKDIYDAKSAALNPQYENYINPQEINQPSLSKTLSNIREKGKEALERIKARQVEQLPAKEFVKTINGPIDSVAYTDMSKSSTQPIKVGTTQGRNIREV